MNSSDSGDANPMRDKLPADNRSPLNADLLTEPCDEFDPFANVDFERVTQSTEAQREVWLASQMSDAANLAFNEAIELSFEGELRIEALQVALQLLVARHESLRACFSDDGLQFIVASASNFAPELVDLRRHDPGSQQAELRRRGQALVSQPFDLRSGPLLRAQIVSLHDQRHLLLLCAHHIVCDGWSFAVLATDLAALYSAQVRQRASDKLRDPVEPVLDQYSAYCVAETEQRGSVEYANDERWWITRFDQPPPTLELPLDRARPVQRGYASKRLDWQTAPGLLASLQTFAGNQGGSLFGVLLCGFASLLYRLSGQDDLVIGVPAAGQVTAEMPGLIGHCVNFLPLRLKVDPSATALAQFATTQGAMLDAFDHQRYTLGTLLKSLQLKRDPGRPPLVSVMFNLDQRLDGNALRFDGLRAELQSLPRAFENFELFLNLTPHGDRLRLECQYNSQLFEESSIAAWLASYCALLEQLVRAPNTPVNALTVLDHGQTQMLARWNQSATVVAPTIDLRRILRSRSLEAGDQVAVIAGRARLTHTELASRVDRLARLIRAKGVAPGARVGISLPRSAEMLVAVLAVLEAGAAFVPLDPSFPAQRLQHMITDAELALLISDSALIQALPWHGDSILIDRDAGLIAEQDDTALELGAQPHDPAYVLYTSGSSGQPKGVVVPRSALGNFLLSMRQQPGMGPNDRLLAVTTWSFDIALLELLLPIVCGAAVVIATREQVQDGHAMIEQIEQHHVNLLQATPSGWRVLIEAGWQGRNDFKALVGGETLPLELAQQLLARCGEVWNLYGPTETTIWSTCCKLEAPLTSISIGGPIANTQIYLLDPHGQDCPIAARGEICIAGAGLAAGYWKRDALSAEKFIVGHSSQTDGIRLYRTGDLGRWRAGGQLEHLGRLDAQIKLRGYRIELGDVEAAIGQLSGVAEATALVREDRPGDPRLVAYVGAASGARLEPEALRQQLKTQLPDYMIPQHLVLLPALPRLPNTKINRAALPPPAEARITLDPAAPAAASRAATALESELAAIFGKVLGLVDVGIDQDFFSLGGHSLSAAQLVARINRQLATQLAATVPLRAVFEAPSAAALVRWIDDRARASKTSLLPDAEPIPRRADRSRAPLSLAQQRLWFLEQLHPGRSLYNTPSAHRLRGPLKLAALQTALEQVVQAQDVLRSHVELDGGEPVQRIQPKVHVDLAVLDDLSGLPAASREAELQQRLDAMIEVPFDLLKAPLFVARLFKLSPEEHVLFFMPHHFIWDGWSFDLFYDEISAAYVAALDSQPVKSPQADDTRLSYGDYCAWQRDWLKGAEFERQLGYWRDKLVTHHQIRPLATDYPRRASMSGRGSTEWIKLDRKLVASLRGVAAGGDATLFMVLLSAYSLLLTTLGSHGYQSIGVPVRGRSRPETESLMGYFTNLLPLVLRPQTEQRFVDLLSEVKLELFGAYANPDVPIEHLLSSLTGSGSATPLYQALFSFQDARSRPLDWGNLRHERFEVAQKGATEDFGLWLVESDAGLVGGLTYNTDLYRVTTAQSLHQQFLQLLENIAAEPNASIALLLPRSATAEGPRELSESGTVTCQNQTRNQTQTQIQTETETETQSQTPAQARVQTSTSRPAAPALTDAEQALADIWRTLLKIDSIEAQENFFDLGGNSLLAMQAVALSEQHFKTKVDPRRYVFESLAQLAKAYRTSGGGSTAAKPGLLGRLFGRGRGLG